MVADLLVARRSSISVSNGFAYQHGAGAAGHRGVFGRLKVKKDQPGPKSVQVSQVCVCFLDDSSLFESLKIFEVYFLGVTRCNHTIRTGVWSTWALWMSRERPFRSMGYHRNKPLILSPQYCNGSANMIETINEHGISWNLWISQEYFSLLKQQQRQDVFFVSISISTIKCWNKSQSPTINSIGLSTELGSAFGFSDRDLLA